MSPNSLIVMAKGISIVNSLALFLSQYTKTEQSSPYLIFLLNFSDTEIAAVDLYLKQNGANKLPIHKIHSAESSISNKRLDLYLKGGIFFVTYKILVLDLLSKKLSASIITGLIVNNAHKAGGKGAKTGESFLAEIIRKGNPDAHIKAITDKSQALSRGSVESLMKALHVNNLILYPRIKKSIKDSLDEVPGLEILEH
jgi:DNA excision repair protein ERCC-4